MSKIGVAIGMTGAVVLTLTADSAGNLYAAWADFRNGDTPHVRCASCRADGSGGDQRLP